MPREACPLGLSLYFLGVKGRLPDFLGCEVGMESRVFEKEVFSSRPSPSTVLSASPGLAGRGP